jgi:hypothetical protein
MPSLATDTDTWTSGNATKAAMTNASTKPIDVVDAIRTGGNQQLNGAIQFSERGECFLAWRRG